MPNNSPLTPEERFMALRGCERKLARDCCELQREFDNKTAAVAAEEARFVQSDGQVWVGLQVVGRKFEAICAFKSLKRGVRQLERTTANRLAVETTLELIYEEKLGLGWPLTAEELSVERFIGEQYAYTVNYLERPNVAYFTLG